MCRVNFFFRVTVCTALGFTLAAAAARAADEETVQAVLGALKDEGVIDAAQYSRIVSKNTAQERAAWWRRIAWFGDFRFRHESFLFSEDATGNERRDRLRSRYRLRVGARAPINDYASVTFRISSATGTARSRNQTLGFTPDFRPDSLWIDQAYATLSAPETWFLGHDASAKLILGKQPNPFLRKPGKDTFPWDTDLTPGGATLVIGYAPDHDSRLSAIIGYFVVQEFDTRGDPHLAGVQLRGEHQLTRVLAVGAQASYYAFRSLDSGFFARGESRLAGSTGRGGNLVGGLAGGDGVDIGDFGVYAKVDRFQEWPLLFYARFFQNWSARATRYGGKEDNAWGVGLELGRESGLVKLGVAYWWVEANAFPGQFLDATYIDGLSNRRGFNFFAGREILTDTTLRLSLFVTEAIDDDLLDPDGSGGTQPALSVVDAERVRITADVMFEF